MKINPYLYPILTFSNVTIAENILYFVCKYYNLTNEQIKSKTRKREIVQARQIAMYLAKNYTKLTLQQIGFEIGYKDHATVLHAIKTINNLIDTNKQVRIDIQKIEKSINQLIK